LISRERSPDAQLVSRIAIIACPAVRLIGYVSGSLCRGYLGWLLKERPQILQLVEQVPDIVTGTLLPVQVQVGDF
jgi:hypothetical protein